MTSPVSVGIVGTGWRADFFARIAQALPDRFEVVGFAVRRPEAADLVKERWQVPAYFSPSELQQHATPDFVVTSVPWDANPHVVADLADAGAHVLSETPPAPDLDGLRALWSRVGTTDRVQVAEQYPFFPGHAARREIVRRGAIGEVSSVHVSSTHGYHAVALMRSLLGVTDGEPVTVSASSFTDPLVDPLVRDAWTGDESPRPARNVIATLDFGGRSGVYDFTDNQWHNRLRQRRVLVRGSHGEIADDTVVRLAGPETILTGHITRSQLGHDLNLEGHDTEHLSYDGGVVYRNPFAGARFSDEEIAIATVMAGTGAWARGEGEAPYPLAQGCQDHLVSLALDESERTGRPVTTTVEPWAAGLTAG